jgi:hypothetical protein
MDENVLVGALRLDEPKTFGRVEPLHDTGRHRALSPFWNFDDTGAPHRIQDVVCRARPYCLVAITKKFDQSELDHRPTPASDSTACIRACAAIAVWRTMPVPRRSAKPWVKLGVKPAPLEPADHAMEVAHFGPGTKSLLAGFRAKWLVLKILVTGFKSGQF